MCSDEELTPGTYAVYATYGCAGGQGGNFKIVIGGRTLDGEVEPTGAWENYQTKRVGEVTLVQRKTNVCVSTVSINKPDLWNFRSVALKRTK